MSKSYDLINKALLMDNGALSAFIPKDIPKIPKPKGFGARHTQSLILLMSLLVGYTIRSHLGVSLVAMTSNHGNFKTSDAEFNETRKKYHESLNDTSYNYEHVDWNCNETTSLKTVYRVYPWHKATQEMMLISFFIGYTCMQLPTGIVVQRFGGKIPIVIGLFINGVLSIATPWAALLGGWLGVCSCRLLQGVTQASLYPGINYMLGKWVPLAERGRLVSFVFNGAQMGAVCGFQTAGWLADSPMFGWPCTFWILGGICIFTSGIVWYFGASYPSSHATISAEEFAYITQELSNVKTSSTPWRRILRCKSVWGLVLTHAGSNVFHAFSLNETPLYFKSVLGVNLQNVGFLSSLPFAVMSIFCPIFGQLSDYLTTKGYLPILRARRLFNGIGMVVCAIFLIAFSFVNNVTWAVVLLMLSTSLHAGVFAGFHVTYIDLSPNYAGAIMGFSNMLAHFISSSTVALTMSTIVGDDMSNPHKWRTVIFIIGSILFITNTIYTLTVKDTPRSWDSIEISNKLTQMKKSKSDENRKRELDLISYTSIPQTVYDLKTL